MLYCEILNDLVSVRLNMEECHLENNSNKMFNSVSFESLNEINGVCFVKSLGLCICECSLTSVITHSENNFCHFPFCS